MTDERDALTDRAIETATDRTKTAEDDYLETAATDDDSLGRAAEVERRAEDLAVLAADPAEEHPPANE
jgi:hypothetical protein